MLDPQRQLVRKAGATVTPEAAVFRPDGALAYGGRIDDRFPEIGISRDQPRTTELRDALDAILAGKPVHAFVVSARLFVVHRHDKPAIAPAH